MRNKYFVNYPRNFNNEYIIFVVDSKENENKLKEELDVYRVSYKFIKNHYATRKNQNNYGCFYNVDLSNCFNPTLNEYISECLTQTRQMLEV